MSDDTMSDDVILEMRAITKTFPGVLALKDVSLSVRSGEIHAICGENGAGKSTLMKILSGVHPHGTYDGEIAFEGKPVQFRGIRDSEHHGIVIIHQELALSPYLSIAENIFLGNERSTHGVIDWNRTDAEAAKLLARVGLSERPDTKIFDIGVGKQQLVEIAKALSKEVKLLILDEPTAALNDEDSARLLDLIRSLRERDITCIIISHKLNELIKIADRTTVGPDGDLDQLVELVADDDAGDVPLPQGPDEVEQARAVLVVQGGRRLIEDEQLDLLGQRLGDLDKLLLADADVEDLGVRAFRQAHPGEELGGLGVGPVPVDDAVRGALVAQEDVLGDRQVGAQRELLVDDHDAVVLAVPDPAELDRLALEGDLAVIGAVRVHPGENLHQGGLACPVLPANRVNLPRADRERDVLQREDTRKGLGDRAHLEDDVVGHGVVGHGCSLSVVPRRDLWATVNTDLPGDDHRAGRVSQMASEAEVRGGVEAGGDQRVLDVVGGD